MFSRDPKGSAFLAITALLVCAATGAAAGGRQ